MVGNYLCKFFLVLFLALFSGVDSFAKLEAVPLQPDQDSPLINNYVYFSENYEGELFLPSIEKNIHLFQRTDSSSIEFGMTKDPVTVVFKLRNNGQEPGDWILSMGRTTFYDLKLFELKDDRVDLIIDNLNLEQVRKLTWSYMTLASPIRLNPNEEKTYAVVFEPKNSFYLPISVKTIDNYHHTRRIKDALIFGSIFGILVLVVVNVSFFVFTNRKEFIWLAIAEAFYTLEIFSSGGYANYFYGFSDPAFSNSFSITAKCFFSASMAKFAKDFILTKENYPKIDKALTVLILFAFMIFFHTVYYQVTNGGFNVMSLSMSWILTLIIALILPYVAVTATININRNYWPLSVAWMIFALFILYGLVHTLDLFQILPLVPELIGPVGLIEIILASLALSLQTGSIYKESLKNQSLLTKSFKERLGLSEKARLLAEEKADAIAVIGQQSNLIHASGHDSRQVISALNSAVFLLNKGSHKNNETQLKEIIESSSDYLKKIISSTLSGARIALVGTEFIGLSRFSSDDIFTSLDMLYKRQALQKGLILDFHYSSSDFLISDLAILTRCLSNFISNSLNFTPAGKVLVSGCKRDANYIIEIEDTGVGVSEEILKKLNGANKHRIHSDIETSGTGSGYLFSKNLINSIGGLVTISSGKKGNAKVTVSLPMQKTYTPCSLDEFRQLLPEIDIEEYDPYEDDDSFDVFNHSKRIAVTYDDSAVARDRISSNYQMVMYMPLCKEYAAQIMLIEAKSNQAL
ncbi:MAG: ATP-binding protein [Maricaulaceae bacterium]